MANKIVRKSKSSAEYWRQREAENLKKYLLSEEEYVKRVHEILDYTADQIQREINGFYSKYADKEEISIADAKRRIKEADVEAFARKAKRYVKEKNFSKQANDEMRLYNATMKINRLELLKANIGLELVAGFDELQKYDEEILTERTREELERQAGILGNTVQNNEKMVSSIVNASFHHATYSDRIWMYQAMMKTELDKLLRQGLIQGKNPRQLTSHLQKLFGVSKYNAERLMRTELARVQIDAQKQSYERNNFEQYTFLALGTACEACLVLDGKHFNVKDMMPGENAPPIHPNCRCSTSAYVDESSYNEWLDTYQEHGMSFEEWKQKNSVAKTGESDIIEPEDKGDLFTDPKNMSNNLEEMSLQVNNFLDSLNLPSSKWSGATKVVERKDLPGAIGRTKSNGDIWLRSGAGVKTVIHEHLHTRSVLYNTKAYRKYKWFEENACEMLAEELCNKYGVKYIRTYKSVVEPLRDIARTTNYYVSDYDFAVDYFNAGIENREQWLTELANKEKDLSVKERILKSIEEIRNVKKP